MWSSNVYVVGTSSVHPLYNVLVSTHSALHQRTQHVKERQQVCRLCSTACPAYAISIAGGISILLHRSCSEYLLCTSRCIYCGWCDTVCPVSAILVACDALLAAIHYAMLLAMSEQCYTYVYSNVLASGTPVAVSINGCSSLRTHHHVL